MHCAGFSNVVRILNVEDMHCTGFENRVMHCTVGSKETTLVVLPIVRRFWHCFELMPRRRSWFADSRTTHPAVWAMGSVSDDYV